MTDRDAIARLQAVAEATHAEYHVGRRADGYAMASLRPEGMPWHESRASTVAEAVDRCLRRMLAEATGRQLHASNTLARDHRLSRAIVCALEGAPVSLHTAPDGTDLHQAS